MLDLVRLDTHVLTSYWRFPVHCLGKLPTLDTVGKPHSSSCMHGTLTMFRLAHVILACLQHGPSLRDFFSIGACVSVWTVFSCTGLALCELANGNGISCLGSLFILLSRVPASGLGPLKTASLLPSRSLAFGKLACWFHSYFVSTLKLV